MAVADESADTHTMNSHNLCCPTSLEKSDGNPEGQPSDLFVASPKTPVCSEEDRALEDSEEKWTRVCNHRRGKHPKKNLFK